MSNQNGNKDLITINVDGKDVQVPNGINVIEAAAIAGKEIPHYCYHPKLTIAGNCRMCLMEMGMPMRDRGTREPILDENGIQKIGWMPKPAIACATNASPGMHIKTDTPTIKECRNGVMEFLLVNHPLDCPICDQAGECSLQEFATDYGKGYSRFVENKNVKPKKTDLGSRVMLDDERCILCSRCVRFSQEIANDDVLGFVDRGSYSTLTCFPGKKLENNYSLNTVDICPVGALTSKDFRFKMRVWFLKETESISTECSVGVNTIVSSREGKIYRITPRRNDEVNDTWMPDSGRELYKTVDSDDRLFQYTLDGKPVELDDAISAAAELIKGGKVAFVGSGRSSVEEQWLFNNIVKSVENAPAWLVSKTGDEDGLLLSKDRNPNVRGALVVGLIKNLPDQNLTELSAQIDSGEIKTIVCLKEDLTKAGISKDQLKKVDVIYFASHCNETNEVAKVVLPILTVFEKSGSYINQQFRVQKFSQAVPGPNKVFNDIMVLSKLMAALNNEKQITPTPEQIWHYMSDEISILKGISFKNIPATGQLLDSTAFNDLPFCEGQSLHYEPSVDQVL